MCPFYRLAGGVVFFLLLFFFTLFPPLLHTTLIRFPMSLQPHSGEFTLCKRPQAISSRAQCPEMRFLLRHNLVVIKPFPLRFVCCGKRKCHIIVPHVRAQKLPSVLPSIVAFPRSFDDGFECCCFCSLSPRDQCIPVLCCNTSHLAQF